jgi:putative aldouronate transport system substrate-binding protein
LKRLGALLASLLLLMSGCTGNGDAPSSSKDRELRNKAVTSAKENLPQSDAYGKYEKPVTVKIGFKVPESTLSGGNTNDNNPISRYFESMTNIKVEHSWEAKGEEAFKQKVNLAIASGDLPDAMVVDRDQLKKLLANDMIEDLSQVFTQYGSELVQAIYESTNGQALQEATFDGKLYGLSNIAIKADSTSLLWYRQDWLDKLGLSPPTTISEIEKVALAFAQQDPDGDGKANTVGLAGDKTILYGQKPNMNGFEAIFHSFYSFPKNWVKGTGGAVIYGSIMPETKQALSLLADWYKRGVIDPQFVLYKETQEPITSNRAGLFFGPWWMPYWPLSDSVARDTKAEWRAIASPIGVNGRFVTHAAPVTDRYLVVRKGFEHPEAIIKLLNMFTRLERRQDPNEEQIKMMDDFAAQSGVQLRHYYPFDLLLDYSNAIETRYMDLQKVMNGEMSSASLDPDTLQLYEMTLFENDNPKKNMDAWKASNAYKYGAKALRLSEAEEVHSVFFGSTATMDVKWAELEKLENEVFLQIIVGDQPISAFDGFVQRWKELGGEQITQEVAASVARD